MELKKRSSAVGKEEHSSAVFKMPPWRHIYTLQRSGYFPHLPSSPLQTSLDALWPGGSTFIDIPAPFREPEL